MTKHIDHSPREETFADKLDKLSLDIKVGAVVVTALIGAGTALTAGLDSLDKHRNDRPGLGHTIVAYDPSDPGQICDSGMQAAINGGANPKESQLFESCTAESKRLEGTPAGTRIVVNAEGPKNLDPRRYLDVLAGTDDYSDYVIKAYADSTPSLASTED